MKTTNTLLVAASLLVAATIPASAQTAQTAPTPTARAAAAPAASSPAGLWNTVDDRTGEVRGAIRIVDIDGTLYGRIAKVFDPKAIGQVCVKCRDDRHDKPILGLDVIRGLHPDGPGAWSGGEILDPETGDTYRVSLRLEDGGQKLVVRGSILGGLIGRSQTWLRAGT